MSSADMTPPSLPPRPGAPGSTDAAGRGYGDGDVDPTEPAPGHPDPAEGSSPPDSLSRADVSGEAVSGTALSVEAVSGAAVSAEAVSAATVSAATRKRRNRRRWIWGLTFVVGVGIVLVGLFLPTPYVLIQPGAVRPAEDRVVIEGGAESYETDNDVLFTTVYVDDATPFGLIRGAFDDAIEVRSTEEVYGDRGRDETRRINRQEMDLSKLVATQQALEYLDIPTELVAEGVTVLGVDEASPSNGILEPGDVIVAVDSQEVSMPSELREQLATRAPGDVVSLTVRRTTLAPGESASASEESFDTLTLDATLADAQGRAVLGVSVEPYKPRIDSEVELEVDSGEVTGPSAGLAWSLAIIDVLTPESMVTGGDVAVTGEILGDGSVGVIGGIAQKTATVVRNGVSTFIYPADTPEAEQDEMRSIAGDDLELVPVATLAEAVEYLRNR
ncbi:MAG: S16 family serine protease [Microthrixaceae bacterium]